MAYDEILLKRIKAIAADRKHLFEMKMFGGVGFLLKGNMCFGIFKNYLILRLGPEQALKALKRSGVKHFDITGRPMRGWVMVADKTLATKQKLTAWIDHAIAFVSPMPRK